MAVQDDPDDRESHHSGGDGNEVGAPVPDAEAIMLQLVQPAVADWDLRREHGQSRSDEAGRAAPVPSERRTHQHRTVVYPTVTPCAVRRAGARPQKQVRGPAYRRGPCLSRKSFARQLECLSHKAVMWEAGLIMNAFETAP